MEIIKPVVKIVVEVPYVNIINTKIIVKNATGLHIANITKNLDFAKSAVGQGYVFMINENEIV